MKLVVLPLPIELKAFMKALEKSGHRYVKAEEGPLASWYFDSLNLCCAVGGHGKVQFGIQTQHLIQKYSDAEAIFCVGTGGALSPEVSIFDVVVAAQTIEHDFKEKFFKKPAPDFLGDPILLEKIRGISTIGFRTHVGIVVSGDEDIVEKERAEELRNTHQAMAVAWEGAGGARAARFMKVPYLEVRGISDLANHESSSHFVGNLERVMENCAKVIQLLAEV